MDRVASHPLTDLGVPLALAALGLAIGASLWPLAGVVLAVGLGLAGLRRGDRIKARWRERSKPRRRAARQAGELSRDLAETMEMHRATAEVLKVIGQSNLRAVFRTVSENAAKVCDADGAVILRLDGDVYRLECAVGSPPGHVELLERNPIPPGRGTLVGKVALERRIVQIPDVLEDPDYSWEELQRTAGFRTLLGVPMLEGDEVIAVISLWRREVKPFGKRAIGLVTTLATEGAIAIQNARLVRELEEKTQQLEVVSRHKSEFLANMSHELRTPLNAVIGFSEVLLEGIPGPVNEKQREYLRDICQSGRHLLDLLDDILDLSKVEAGRMDLEIGEFSLVEAVDHGIKAVREDARRRRIALRRDIERGLDIVTGDELRITQVILNLLSNAVKFTGDGGSVDVLARPVGEEVQVAVRDTGIGIAEDQRARIFDSFHQGGRRANRAQIKGTGLGLTLSKKIVELHGGRIWVESELGVGSTFTFAIPLRQPPPTVGPPRES